MKLPLGEISPLFIECVTTYESFFTERRNFTSVQNLTCDGPLNSIKNSQHFWLLVIMVYIFLDFSCHIPSLLVSLSLCNARFYTTMDHQCLNFVFQAHRLPRSLQILILAAFQLHDTCFLLFLLSFYNCASNSLVYIDQMLYLCDFIQNIFKRNLCATKRCYWPSKLLLSSKEKD